MSAGPFSQLSPLFPQTQSFQCCLFVFQQDYTKTTEPVLARVKLGGRVVHEQEPIN